VLSFLATCILLEVTPGPNMTWLAILAATRGRAAALSAVAGIALGLAIAGAVAATGVSALTAQFPILLDALRWAGSLYLLYLAYDAWRGADGLTKETDSSLKQNAVQGLLTNILNPKAYLFYAVMLPQFADRQQPLWQQLTLLTIIYVAVATVIHASIAIAAGGLKDWLSNSPQAIILRKAFALTLAATALWFFYSAQVKT
jgi:threonine/homoserine/homoserine lactone efflux protein